MSDPASITRAALIALLQDKSVRFGDFVLASGAHSSWYIDCRVTTMSARGQQLIGALGLAAIADAGWMCESVGGLTMGADPVAYAIAHASAGSGHLINAFSVRKQPKDHGTGRRIEGNFRPGSLVVVVEDVITSGNSALTAIDAVRAEGGEVAGVLAVVDRGANGRSAIESAGVPVVALTTAHDLGVAVG